MNKTKTNFQDYLEWELLEVSQKITNLTFECGTYNINKNCIIELSRDAEYNLCATISGIIKDRNELNSNIKEVKGEVISNEKISGYTPDGLYKYIISGMIGSSTVTGLSANPISMKFEATLVIYTVEKIFEPGAAFPIHSIQEWFLSSKLNIHFPRSTKRQLNKNYTKTREGIDKTEDFLLAKSSSSSTDYLIVNFDNTSFIVSKVPNEFGPDWSCNLSIEYRESFGRIPNKGDREAISELVGFVFGNQIQKIGQTSYSNDFAAIGQKYQNPWSDNTISKCSQGSLPPVEIGNYRDWGRAEVLLNELISPYLEKRDSFQLKDTLWKYWIARDAVLGTNLPILSSAVETLAERIIKKTPDVKHYYMKYNKFSELIAEEILSIQKKLEGNTNKDKIINKIKAATQRGSNEKLLMMFEIINLEVGNLEKKAIKARNKMAHSSSGNMTTEQWVETLRLTRAYETLFNRVFLKILDYKGKYKDYYTFEHPDRDIDTPIPD